MFRGRFIIFSGYTTFLLLFLYLVNCSAKKNHNHHCDNPSSCGSIVNIRYPFRLKGDPDSCGDPNYELACENNNTLVFHSYRGKYKVQAINYNNSTIRVVDDGVQKSNCSSLPLYYLTYPYPNFYTRDSYPYTKANDTKPITFVKCENPATEPRYIDTASCVNINNGTAPNSTKKHYSYVILGYVTPSDLVDSCTIDLMAVISASDQDDQTSSISFTDIHSKLAVGFELSWHHIFCEECNGRRYCQLDSDYNVIGCKDIFSWHYHYHHEIYWGKPAKYSILELLEIK